VSPTVNYCARALTIADTEDCPVTKKELSPKQQNRDDVNVVALKGV